MPQSAIGAHPARAGAAAGLVVAGVAALVVAWVLGDDFAAPEPAPWWVRVTTVVVVLLLAGLVWVRRRSDDRTVRLTALGAAGVALVLTVLAALGFADQYGRGFPGQSTVLAALGGLAVTVGVLLGHRTAGGWRRLPAVGAFLLVAALTTPLVLVTPDMRLDATTAGATRAVPVSAVSRVAWSTEVDGPVRDVVPAGAGVVLLLDDGVVALDGTTGHVRWTRMRHGAEAVQLDASPDGATVVVQFRPRDRFPIRKEIIDAATGEVRFTVDTENEGASPGLITPVTNTSYIGANDDETEFSGHSLTDGRRLWTYRAPTGCWLKTDHAAQLAVPTGMLLPLLCGKDWRDKGFTEFRYVLVDATTGTTRWTHDMRWQEPTNGVEVNADLAPDHRFVAVEVSTDNFMTPATARAVLDTGTGEALPAPVPARLAGAGIATEELAGGDTQLVDVTTGRTLPSTPEIRSCVASDHGVSLASGTVCVDPKLDSFESMIRGGRIDLAVGAFTGGALRLVPVALGGPFDTSRLGDEKILFAAAPGAVVVTTGLHPVGNGRVRVVGLR